MTQSYIITIYDILIIDIWDYTLIILHNRFDDEFMTRTISYVQFNLISKFPQLIENLGTLAHYRC
jgi:hypothetical protein